MLELASRDEGFALWLDARFAVSLAGEASTLLDPEPFRRRAEVPFSAAHPDTADAVGTNGVPESMKRRSNN